MRRDEAVSFLATGTLPSFDGKGEALKPKNTVPTVTVGQGGRSLMFLGCFCANVSRNLAKINCMKEQDQQLHQKSA